MFRCPTFLPSPLQMCMGLCNQDMTEEGKRAKLQNSIIEHDICEHAKSELNVTKVLMLGAAESGKSTLLKQIKIIHSHGFSKQELISFKPAVLNNLLTSMKFLLQGMGKLRINLTNKKHKVHARAILSCVQCYGEDQELLPFVAHAFYALWTDQGVRTAQARGAEFELNDSALYFFENISRIIAPNFIPSEMDVLRARVRTCGIIETQFEVNETIFRLYDVGAQQSLKRKKWLGCFDCVQAVLFVVDLSGYDVNMMDDPSPGTHRSRLQASLDLFTSIYSTNTVFKDTPWILFMNKTDLFREKILYSGRHLRLYLPSYEGADGDVDAAAYHIATMFMECNNKPNKPIYHHFTIATDTSNIRVVFEVLMEQIKEKENGDRIATVTLL